MKTRQFLEFKGKKIYYTTIDGEHWIALKPICEALGILWRHQHSKLKEKDNIFNELYRAHGIVASDNKERNMICLQENHIYGWIFNIPISSSMSAETRKNMKEYKLKCSEILYKHFKGSITDRKEILKKIKVCNISIETTKRNLRKNKLYTTLLVLEKENKKYKKQLKNIDASIIDNSKKLSL